jgi:hypothetical protein
MIPTLIVVGGLLLIMRAMLYYDSKERRRKQKFQPDIEGRQVGNESVSRSESDLVMKQELSFFVGIWRSLSEG